MSGRLWPRRLLFAAAAQQAQADQIRSDQSSSIARSIPVQLRIGAPTTIAIKQARSPLIRFDLCEALSSLLGSSVGHSKLSLAPSQSASSICQAACASPAASWPFSKPRATSGRSTKISWTRPRPIASARRRVRVCAPLRLARAVSHTVCALPLLLFSPAPRFLFGPISAAKAPKKSGGAKAKSGVKKPMVRCVRAA